MKRTGIYMRVSSDKQVQEGDSIAAQKDALNKYINDHDDMILAGEYLDDGVSGTKEDRDELQRMLSDVQDGKIDLIIATKLDRIYRSIRHYLNFQDTLDKCGVPWLAIWEPIYDTSTPQGRLIINQMMSIAQFEAENTGQRIRQVQAYKVSQGEVISGSTPPGYSIVDKKLVPDADAPKVKELFEYYSRYGNLAAAIRYVADDPAFPNSSAAMKRVLKNDLYIGKKRGNDHFCEPIISRELFEDVQRKLKMNVKKSQRHTYIFSGLIVCKECGTKFGSFQDYHKKKTKTVRLPAYRCTKRYCRGGLRQCTNKKVIEEHVLERYLLEHIRPQIKDLILHYEIEQKPVKDYSSRIASLEKKKEKLKELYINELISLEEYKTDREQIDSDISATIAKVGINDTDLTALKDLLTTDFESLYGTFSPDENRYFWRSVIKEIRFGIDRKYEVIFLT